MTIRALFSNAQNAARRAVDAYEMPKREAAWSAKHGMFVHENQHGMKFELDPREYIDGYIFREGVYERRFLELLRGNFDKEAVALDIGANIGNHAIYLASTFQSIYCFEPNPAAFNRLRTNIRLNGLSNIHVHEVGLGKTAGMIPFEENDHHNLGGSRFLRDGGTETHAATLHLQIENADGYIAGLHLGRVDFVKVDVEGWEPDLFEGLASTIKRHRPLVAFEFHAQDAQADDFARIMSALDGYITLEARYADAGASKVAKLVRQLKMPGGAELVRFKTPELRTYENILAFPSEQALAKFEARRLAR